MEIVEYNVSFLIMAILKNTRDLNDTEEKAQKRVSSRIHDN